MTLVKDFIDFKIVYYWQDDDGQIISPHFYAFIAAEEWWKQHMFSLYIGEERRSTTVDRRKNFARRNKMDDYNFTSSTRMGRRKTDKPIKVELDHTQKKLTELVLSSE